MLFPSTSFFLTKSVASILGTPFSIGGRGSTISISNSSTLPSGVFRILDTKRFASPRPNFSPPRFSPLASNATLNLSPGSTIEGARKSTISVLVLLCSLSFPTPRITIGTFLAFETSNSLSKDFSDPSVDLPSVIITNPWIVGSLTVSKRRKAESAIFVPENSPDFDRINPLFRKSINHSAPNLGEPLEYSVVDPGRSHISQTRRLSREDELLFPNFADG